MDSNVSTFKVQGNSEIACVNGNKRMQEQCVATQHTLTVLF